jgi:anti-anti-sigma factor
MNSLGEPYALREINGKNYLTTGEAARRLGVSTKTLLRWTEKPVKTEALQKLVWFVDPTNERLRYFEETSVEALRKMVGIASGSLDVVSTKEIGDILVISPHGSFFGGRETEELREAFMNASSSGNLRLVVDLADCSSVNSHTLGVMMHVVATYRKSGGEVRFCAPQKRVRELFAITRVAGVFDIDENEEASVAAFGKKRKKS